VKLIRVFIKDLEAFGRWVENKIEDAPAWLTHLMVLTAKMITAPQLAKITAHAEQLVNDFVQAKGTTLAELALTEVEHTGLFEAVVAGAKVFFPNVAIPDIHTLAALGVSYALRGVTIVEDEINALEGKAVVAAGVTEATS
jgi:hypothetical protein